MSLDSLIFPGSPKESWKQEHNKAVRSPKGIHEQSIVAMLGGWLCFSRSYYETFGIEVGSNPIVGASWARIGWELKILIACSDVGRLDRPALEKAINKRLRSEGYREESGLY